MLVEYFKTLYDYNYWANAKILEVAEQVSEAQFIEETPESHGSLRGTLVHILSGYGVRAGKVLRQWRTCERRIC